MERGTDGSVVIVGAGILGCSIAVHLADRGVRPVLIDPDRPEQGTSTGSFASITAFGKDPAAWFQRAVAGVSGWTRFGERLGGQGGLRRGGEVRWAAGPEEGHHLAALLARSRERGYPVLLARHQLARHQLTPGLAEALYGAAPPVVLVAVAAASVAPGDRLSGPLERALPEVAEVVVRVAGGV